MGNADYRAAHWWARIRGGGKTVTIGWDDPRCIPPKSRTVTISHGRAITAAAMLNAAEDAQLPEIIPAIWDFFHREEVEGESY